MTGKGALVVTDNGHGEHCQGNDSRILELEGTLQEQQRELHHRDEQILKLRKHIEAIQGDLEKSNKELIIASAKTIILEREKHQLMEERAFKEVVRSSVTTPNSSIFAFAPFDNAARTFAAITAHDSSAQRGDDAMSQYSLYEGYFSSNNTSRRSSARNKNESALANLANAVSECFPPTPTQQCSPTDETPADFCVAMKKQVADEGDAEGEHEGDGEDSTGHALSLSEQGKENNSSGMQPLTSLSVARLRTRSTTEPSAAMESLKRAYSRKFHTINAQVTLLKRRVVTVTQERDLLRDVCADQGEQLLRLQSSVETLQSEVKAMTHKELNADTARLAVSRDSDDSGNDEDASRDGDHDPSHTAVQTQMQQERREETHGKAGEQQREEDDEDAESATKALHSKRIVQLQAQLHKVNLLREEALIAFEEGLNQQQQALERSMVARDILSQHVSTLTSAVQAQSDLQQSSELGNNNVDDLTAMNQPREPSPAHTKRQDVAASMSQLPLKMCASPAVCMQKSSNDKPINVQDGRKGKGVRFEEHLLRHLSCSPFARPAFHPPALCERKAALSPAEKSDKGDGVSDEDRLPTSQPVSPATPARVSSSLSSPNGTHDAVERPAPATVKLAYGNPHSSFKSAARFSRPRQVFFGDDCFFDSATHHRHGNSPRVRMHSRHRSTTSSNSSSKKTSPLRNASEVTPIQVHELFRDPRRAPPELSPTTRLASRVRNLRVSPLAARVTPSVYRPLFPRRMGWQQQLNMSLDSSLDVLAGLEKLSNESAGPVSAVWSELSSEQNNSSSEAFISRLRKVANFAARAENSPNKKTSDVLGPKCKTDDGTARYVDGKASASSGQMPSPSVDDSIETNFSTSFTDLSTPPSPNTVRRGSSPFLNYGRPLRVRKSPSSTSPKASGAKHGYMELEPSDQQGQELPPVDLIGNYGLIVKTADSSLTRFAGTVPQSKPQPQCKPQPQPQLKPLASARLLESTPFDTDSLKTGTNVVAEPHSGEGEGKGDERREKQQQRQRQRQPQQQKHGNNNVSAGDGSESEETYGCHSGSIEKDHQGAALDASPTSKRAACGKEGGARTATPFSFSEGFKAKSGSSSESSLKAANSKGEAKSKEETSEEASEKGNTNEQQQQQQQQQQQWPPLSPKLAFLLKQSTPRRSSIPQQRRRVSSSTQGGRHPVMSSPLGCPSLIGGHHPQDAAFLKRRGKGSGAIVEGARQKQPVLGSVERRTPRKIRRTSSSHWPSVQNLADQLHTSSVL